MKNNSKFKTSMLVLLIFIAVIGLYFYQNQKTIVNDSVGIEQIPTNKKVMGGQKFVRDIAQESEGNDKSTGKPAIIISHERSNFKASKGYHPLVSNRKKLQKKLIESATEEVGDFLISKNIRAEKLTEAKMPSIMKLEDFSLFEADASSPIQQNEYFTVFDNRHQTIGAATGRMVIEVSDSFDSSELQKLGYFISERPSQDLDIYYIAQSSGNIDFSATFNKLARITGVILVRPEVIYGFNKRQ